MGKKLFEENGDADDDVDLSKIEIDEKYARRFEHNKKREDLHRYEELKKRGQIEDSDSDSSDSELSDVANPSKKEDIKFFENLITVRNQDPRLPSQNVKLFDSESDSEEDGIENSKDEVNKEKKKPKYLKDVIAKQLMEEGAEFDDDETSEKKKKKKSYKEEQDELKKAFLGAVEDAEEEEDSEGDLLKVKERKSGEEENEGDDDNGEFEKKLGEYFGKEEELDENKMFLKEFFMKKLWVDKANNEGKKGFLDDDEVDELIRDEEEIERQERYEEEVQKGFRFRHEENAGDRVMGHSRKVEGSVRKKDNARKEQRKSKEERMRIAEMERKEELKHLKNLKKKEMKERLKKVMEAAGIKDDDDCRLDVDDLEEDFDPEEYDKMMKKAFDETYYGAEDLDPSFGDNDDDEGDIVKPDFDKEDELLGLPKGWDVIEKDDGFLAAREKILKQKAGSDDDYDDKEAEEEGGDGEERREESKRKRKRKISLMKKVKEEMMEEYYKLDYEDTVGDLKTRFKYAKVDPNRFGLKAEEILMLDDKELNQFISIKKIVPYREKEWRVLNRHQNRMRIKELLRGKLNDLKIGKKKWLKEVTDKSTKVLISDEDRKAEIKGSNADVVKTSKKAKRKIRQREHKLSESRLAAYGKIEPKAKKRKH